MAEEKPIYEIRFDAAVKVIQSLPRNGEDPHVANIQSAVTLCILKCK
uniref:Uncharacterized protein n=1 Tax=Anguilla anguilla TaxID=7936 RepID=A0A0E9WFB4_ANGAN